MADLLFTLTLSRVYHKSHKEDKWSSNQIWQKVNKIFKIKVVTIWNKVFNPLSLIIKFILKAYCTLRYVLVIRMWNHMSIIYFSDI